MISVETSCKTIQESAVRKQHKNNINQPKMVLIKQPSD